MLPFISFMEFDRIIHCKPFIVVNKFLLFVAYLYFVRMFIITSFEINIFENERLLYIWSNALKFTEWV